MQRNLLLERLRADQEWDVIVIGGGATGLGTAVDAVTRGYKTLLLEAYDFAKGTSSRSTKLVHGGVRYLAQGNIMLVYEALQERGRLLRNAPHVTKILPFIVPNYSWWSEGFYGAGLSVYSLMAGTLGIGFTKLIGRKKAIKLAPTLEPDGLEAAVVYYDGQFDDARLAISLMSTLLDHGGTALNHLPVRGLYKEGDRVRGVMACDEETGEQFTLHSKAVINCTGVFADDVRKLDVPTVKPMLSPSQGIHIVLDKSFLPGDHAIMIPKTDDGRVLFAIPWYNRVIVGTTDTPVENTAFEPRPLHEEIAFVMKHAARYLTKDPTAADVLSVYVGLRPLVKHSGESATAKLSREHTLSVSPSGLITIIGGKWTTYRHMAEDAVDKAITLAGLPKVACVTKTLRLHGFTTTPEAAPFGVYGTEAADVRQVLAEQLGWDSLLHPKLPYRTGEVVWAARHELARTVEDVLARRLRAILLDARASIEAAPRVAQLLADELGFDQAWQAAQVAEYTELANGYLLPIPEPTAKPAVDLQEAQVETR